MQISKRSGLFSALLCLSFSSTALAQSGGEAITGVTIYADPQAQPVSNAVILIRDGRIEAAGPASKIRVPRDYRVSHLPEKTLVAGFWNSHLHLISPDFLDPDHAAPAALSASLTQMFVRWGFTTVVDLASTTQSAARLNARIASGDVTGPAILTVGEPFYPTGGTPIYARPVYEQFHLPSAEIVSIDQAVGRVGSQVRGGVSAIKLFTGAIVGGEDGVMIMPGDQVRAISNEAHRLKVPVFAHVTNAPGLAAAIDNGVDILAHAAPLAGTWSDDRARQMVDKGIALVPTLALFEVHPHPSTPVSVAIDQTRAIAAQGGDVLFGTDAGFAEIYDTSAELRLMGQAMNWRQVLASLTVTPARRLGQETTSGKVAKGMRADLVVLDADPAGDVTAFSRVRMVWREGKAIYRATEAP